MKIKLTSLSFSIFILLASVAGAATPSSGTLSSGSTTPAAWNGFPGPAYMDDVLNPAGTSSGDANCTEGTNCDTFTLTLAAGDYTGKRAHFNVTWTLPTDDYDVYVHAADGTLVAKSAGSPPASLEQNIWDINRVVSSGVNDRYTIHVVYFTVGPLDAYHGTVALEAIPQVVVRTPKFVTGAKTHLRFSRSRALYANGTASGSEPSVRVDYAGNAYVGSIRGLTGGDDLWRFDLNPSSPTFDPFLKSVRASIDANGNITNPTYKGQPDSTAPDNVNTINPPADGGGDMDIAVGFAPPTPGAPPIVATTSLVAANISSQRSTDRADSFERNPDGNTTVPEDDRNWMEFYGGNVVYLAYREFTGLQSTSKFYVNRSDDGGLTYGPAVLAGLAGNTTGNIAVDQNDGTVYFCYQGDGTAGNQQVRVTVGQPLSPLVAPLVYNTYVAATGKGPTIAALFPCVKVGADGTVYVTYSDAGEGIYLAHSTDHGKTWSQPVKVSNLSAASTSLFPWMVAGKLPGSVGVAWIGTDAADTDDGAGQNNDAANWKVFYAQSFDATAINPTFSVAVASDHYIHGSNISLGGFGGAANRNLGDFFQVALDPHGLALFAFSDDSNDFGGNANVIHQIDGDSLASGRRVNLGNEKADPAPDASLPQVVDGRHDAQVRAVAPIIIDSDSPVDIVNIRYGCQASLGHSYVNATMKVSALSTIPPQGIWRVHFATNPTRPGLSDRADQWFLEADTDNNGVASFKYGTAVRTGGGGFTYNIIGNADSGSFDTTNGTVTMKVDVAKLNALQTRGTLGSGTTLMGLRGSARAAYQTVNASVTSVSAGLVDTTRGGTSYTMPSSCFSALP